MVLPFSAFFASLQGTEKDDIASRRRGARKERREDFTTRFARGTEIRRNREHGDRVNWPGRTPARQIHPTVLIGEKDKRKTPIFLPNRTSMERETVEDWISFH